MTHPYTSSLKAKMHRGAAAADPGLIMGQGGAWWGEVICVLNTVSCEELGIIFGISTLTLWEVRILT